MGGDGHGHNQIHPQKPMSIDGGFRYMPERIAGMTDLDRAWRKQWLKDQILTEREPVFVPEYYKLTNNFVRRGFDAFFDKLLGPLAKWGAKKVDAEFGVFIRKTPPRFLFIYLLFVGAHYEIKHNPRHWEDSLQNWWGVRSRPALFPGDPGYPYVFDMKPSDFYDLGFKDRTIEKD